MDGGGLGLVDVDAGTLSEATKGYAGYQLVHHTKRYGPQCPWMRHIILAPAEGLASTWRKDIPAAVLRLKACPQYEEQDKNMIIELC